jgi:hypothetical protein
VYQQEIDRYAQDRDIKLYDQAALVSVVSLLLQFHASARVGV